MTSWTFQAKKFKIFFGTGISSYRQRLSAPCSLMKKDYRRWHLSTKDVLSKVCSIFYFASIVHAHFAVVAEMRKDVSGDLLRNATLYELLDATRNEGQRRILNGLNFPMGHLSLPPPPRFK
jgi:hypothetical protein